MKSSLKGQWKTAHNKIEKKNKKKQKIQNITILECLTLIMPSKYLAERADDCAAKTICWFK